MSVEASGGEGVALRNDSDGGGVEDVNGVDGGRCTIIVRVRRKGGRNMVMVSVVVRCLLSVVAYAIVMACRNSLAVGHAGLAHLNSGRRGGCVFGLRRGQRSCLVDFCMICKQGLMNSF